MADLSKYKEVAELCLADAVNSQLKQGWELITVKVVEKQFQDREGTVLKKGQTIYVIGRPRDPRNEPSRFGERLGN